jgi:hypothetical protein
MERDIRVDEAEQLDKHLGGTSPKKGNQMNETESIRYIPAPTLKRLNKIAIKHGKYCLTDDCPVLKEGKNVPIVLSIPSFDDGGWVRCQIPGTSDCLNHVCLDIRHKDYQKLPFVGIDSANGGPTDIASE